MVNLVVVFPKLEDAERIKSVLMRSGMTGVFSCNSGAKAISLMQRLGDGIVISAYRLADMTCFDLKQNLPEGFAMLVPASENVISGLREPGIVYLTMPFKVHELIGTLEMMTRDMVRRSRKKMRAVPKERSTEEKELIRRAKELLMERNHMAEEEAHYYMQKCSMDSGTNLVETAQMILAMY